MRFSGETLAILGRPIAFYPVLAEVCGGLGPGVLYCQLTYWHGKQRDPEGWIRKSWPELEAETGMTRREQQGARVSLRRLGLVEERVRGLPPTVEYRLNFAALDEHLTTYCTKRGNLLHRTVQSNAPSGATIPETTPETTAENTDLAAGAAVSAEAKPSKQYLTLCFEGFWEVYPPRRGRRDRKAEALREYLKLAPDSALRKHMLEAVEVYSMGTELPVDACRWIKGRRWEDETVVRVVRKRTPPPRNLELERIAQRERELASWGSGGDAD